MTNKTNKVKSSAPLADTPENGCWRELLCDLKYYARQLFIGHQEMTLLDHTPYTVLPSPLSLSLFQNHASDLLTFIVHKAMVLLALVYVFLALVGKGCLNAASLLVIYFLQTLFYVLSSIDPTHGCLVVIAALPVLFGLSVFHLMLNSSPVGLNPENH